MKPKPLSSGRPEIEVTEYILSLAQEAGKLGFNKLQTARYCGMSDVTFSAKCKNFPGLLMAYEDGRIEGIKLVTKGLLQNATEMSIDSKGNRIGTPGGSVAAQSKYLDQVAEWTQKVQLSGEVKGTVVKIALPSNQRDEK